MSVILEAKKKDLNVKNKKILSDSNIPGVVYGPGFDSTPVYFDYQSFKKVVTKFGQGKIFSMSIDGKNVDVIIKSYDFDKILGTFIHVDFLAVDKERKIIAQIPVELYGQSEAVRLGGILSQKIFNVKIKCLPGNLPDKFRGNIALLKSSGSRICVSDLEGTEGIEILISGNQIVAGILVPRAVAAAVDAAAAAASDAKAKTEDKTAPEKKK